MLLGTKTYNCWRAVVRSIISLPFNASTILALTMLLQLAAFQAQAQAQVQSDHTMTISAMDSATTQVPEAVIKEAYRRLKLPLNVIKLPPARSLKMSNAGQFDAELARVKVDHTIYPNLIQVPVAIDLIDATVFSKSVEFEVDGWDSLKPYRIGIRRGVKFTQRGTQGMNVIVGNENEQLLKMLDRNRVDIVVLNKHNALTAIEQLNLINIRMLQPSVHYLEVFHYLHKKNQHLLPALTHELQQMEQSGEIEAIMKRIRSSKVP